MGLLGETHITRLDSKDFFLLRSREKFVFETSAVSWSLLKLSGKNNQDFPAYAVSLCLQENKILFSLNISDAIIVRVLRCMPNKSFLGATSEPNDHQGIHQRSVASVSKPISALKLLF